jgi:uncharacterized protein (TIGR01777 family)
MGEGRMRVAITGATGLVGRHLTRRLVDRGDEVVAFTRDPDRAAGRFPEGVECVKWITDSPGMLVESLSTVDAVVNLAGEPVLGRRWNRKVKDAIRASRVEGTRTLVGAIAAAGKKPSALVSASAVGYYGPRGDEEIDEESDPGHDFLAQVAVDWETQARKAESLGVRVAIARIGIVLAEDGGALSKMATPFRFFLGGRVASGRQGFPWIHIRDVTGIILHAIDEEAVTGPLNVCAPDPPSNREFCRALGEALRRPSWLPAPGYGLRLMMGEVAGMLTKGQRAVPRRALESGYQFEFGELSAALSDLVGK